MSHPTATGTFETSRRSTISTSADVQHSTPERAPAMTRETLQTIADTVGMVPSMRSQDSIAQGIALLVGLILGVIIGWTVAGPKGLLAGGIIGLISALFISGLVVMIMGWVRVAKRL